MEHLRQMALGQTQTNCQPVNIKKKCYSEFTRVDDSRFYNSESIYELLRQNFQSVHKVIHILSHEIIKIVVCW